MKTKLKSFLTILACVLAAATSLFAGTKSTRHTFAIGTNDFLLDGQKFQIRCGEIHAARVPREYWRNRLQMARAMGLNTVCAYLFWNQIEPQPGKFDWSGQADVAEFCRIAQQEGLWVILRPGPYSCAEWEMGGLPWWLLKNDDIKLRARDPRFMAAAKNYLHEVGKKLAPLQITRGGPILMVQVENEYGSYGKDSVYMGEMRKATLDAGFDVPLFACNPPGDLKNGYRDDLFPVVNFGSNPAKAFKSLREILPQGPLMCGEFYPGWFDTWGAPHHLGNTPQYLADLATMLTNGESFSIYMAHGGTTFGLWSGADHPFKPDTSSYDYDAPISEAGWPAEKFSKTRELFSQHLLPGETIPEPPATNAVIAIAPVEARDCAPIFANLPKAIADVTPRTMEKYDQGHGCILYRTTIPAGAAAPLEAASIHDFGFVFLDGERVGVMDRRTNNFKVNLPAREKPATLDILVEAMGRVNFGTGTADRKGLHAPVKLDGEELAGWQIFNLPLNDKMLARLKFLDAKVNSNSPAFWRATVKIEKTGDTFLDMRPWGKGVVWVNGHCLGRFWNIGPTRTMYVPGPWLKRGKNKIVILDLIGPEKPVVAALDHPILDELHPEYDFNARADLEFRPGEVWQDVNGQPIQAHGGGILVHSNVYYWYGEDRTPEICSAVSCYSSTNLLNWKREGVALWQTNLPRYYDSPTFVERPKVIFNPRTKKFVMWMHAEQAGYHYACAGIATSDTPTGPFVFLKTIRPITNDFEFPADDPNGQKQFGGTFRDMNLFVDDDGNAYVFYSSEDNWTMYVVRLNDDFTGPESPAVENKTWARILVRQMREGAAPFKWNGKYFLITSACTGWSPNAANYSTADNILGTWKTFDNPCVGTNADTTFGSQSTFVLPVPGGTNDFIFMADRWNPQNLPDSRCVWLPFTMKTNGTFTIPWRDCWDFSAFAAHAH